MKTIYLITFILVLSISLFAKNYGDMEIKKFWITEVHDGDTFKIDFIGSPAILGENIGVRISGVDTPEMTSKSRFLKDKAIEAREFVKDKIASAKTIIFKDMKRDKFAGRIDCYVLLDGKDLTKMLIEKKLGYEYFGGQKKTEKEQEEILR